MLIHFCIRTHIYITLPQPVCWSCQSQAVAVQGTLGIVVNHATEHTVGDLLSKGEASFLKRPLIHV